MEAIRLREVARPVALSEGIKPLREGARMLEGGLKLLSVAAEVVGLHDRTVVHITAQVSEISQGLASILSAWRNHICFTLLDMQAGIGIKAWSTRAKDWRTAPQNSLRLRVVVSTIQSLSFSSVGTIGIVKFTAEMLKKSTPLITTCATVVSPVLLLIGYSATTLHNLMEYSELKRKELALLQTQEALQHLSGEEPAKQHNQFELDKVRHDLYIKKMSGYRSAILAVGSFAGLAFLYQFAATRAIFQRCVSALTSFVGGAIGLHLEKVSCDRRTALATLILAS